MRRSIDQRQSPATLTIKLTSLNLRNLRGRRILYVRTHVSLQLTTSRLQGILSFSRDCWRGFVWATTARAVAVYRSPGVSALSTRSVGAICFVYGAWCGVCAGFGDGLLEMVLTRRTSLPVILVRIWHCRILSQGRICINIYRNRPRLSN